MKNQFIYFMLIFEKFIFLLRSSSGNIWWVHFSFSPQYSVYIHAYKFREKGRNGFEKKKELRYFESLGMNRKFF